MKCVQRVNYGEAIRQGFRYLMQSHPEVFAIGQGLWSPWYVGNSMTDLDGEFGRDRVLDTPVSEQACTGAAVGASLCGYRPIVVHPRIDFMLLAVDQIVNQAAKWGHMLGGKARPCVTIRGIINRGGEQGAQHSQSLHSWFAHIPGLRVVMPATVRDARDLLIASVLCDDPVVYIDDRWLYEEVDELAPPRAVSLPSQGPHVLRSGTDITLVGAGYATHLCATVAEHLASLGFSAEVIDLRVLNPLDTSIVADSVARTSRLLAVDGDWATCGVAGEVIASVTEQLPNFAFVAKRVTLANAPAPTSGPLEAVYYPSVEQVIARARMMLEEARSQRAL